MSLFIQVQPTLTAPIERRRSIKFLDIQAAYYGQFWPKIFRKYYIFSPIFNQKRPQCVSWRSIGPVMVITSVKQKNFSVKTFCSSKFDKCIQQILLSMSKTRLKKPKIFHRKGFCLKGSIKLFLVNALCVNRSHTSTYFLFIIRCN